MPETTQNYHRIPVKKKRKGNELRTITLGKGIKALYDVKRKIIVTYLFDKKKYTMKEAKQWVKKHTQSSALSLAERNLVLASELRFYYDELKTRILSKFNKEEGD